MAEVVLGVILLLSLFGNYQQKAHNDSLNTELDHWQEVAAGNHAQWQLAIEVNQTNAGTINLLEQALNKCEERNAATIKRVNDFREATAFKDAALADLRARLDNTDFGACRVPDWVDFSGSATSKD